MLLHLAELCRHLRERIAGLAHIALAAPVATLAQLHSELVQLVHQGQLLL
jgi:hypothetical protein